MNTAIQKKQRSLEARRPAAQEGSRRDQEFVSVREWNNRAEEMLRDPDAFYARAVAARREAAANARAERRRKLIEWLTGGRPHRHSHV